MSFQNIVEKLDKNKDCLALGSNIFGNKKLISKFHNTLEDLSHQKLRDKLKRELCRENEIILLEFPYDIDKYMNDNIKIQCHIAKELKNNTNIKIPKDLPLYNHNTPEFGKYRLDNFF